MDNLLSSDRLMKMKSLQQVLVQKVHYGTVCTLNILVTVSLNVCPWKSKEFCESSATESWNEMNLVPLIYHRDESIIRTLHLSFKHTTTCFIASDALFPFFVCNKPVLDIGHRVLSVLCPFCRLRFQPAGGADLPVSGIKALVSPDSTWMISLTFSGCGIQGRAK